MELGVDRVGGRAAKGVEHGRESGIGVDQLDGRSPSGQLAPPVSTGNPASIQARVPPATLTTS